MHSFKRRRGFQWDVGVHYMGNIGDGGDLRQLFDFLTNHKLDWESMGEVYDVVHIDDKKYEFKAGKEAFRNQLIDYFPEDAPAINAYLKLIAKAISLVVLSFLKKHSNHF